MLDIKLEQQYIIDLVSYTLFDTPFDFEKYGNKELDYKYIATKIHEQKMEGLVYHAMSMLKINNNLFTHLHSRYMSILYTCVQQENEYQELVKLFEANNIDYVPLKGTFMKHHYPKMEMRLMGDIDVLIPFRKKKTIHKLLLENNFTTKKTDYISTHHIIYQKGTFCTFEMHYNLLDVDCKGSKIINKIAWENSNNHQFKSEFNIVYLLAHYHHHFDNGGSSLKPLIDIGLFLLNENINYELLKELLEKTGYYDFYNKCVNVFNKLFNKNIFIYEQKISDKDILEIIEVSFKYGDFGIGLENDYTKNYMLKKISQNEKNSFFAKINFAFSRIFISYDEFKRINKTIKYCPILLPFGWIARFFKYFFSKRKMREKISKINNISEEEIQKYKVISEFLR